MKVDLIDLAARIDAARKELGVARDKLRDLHTDVEALLESADDADTNLENAVYALRTIEEAAERLSEYA